MKTLIFLATLMLSLNASAHLEGDKILFQSDSTYVSAVYNKTLCFDGTNFRAMIFHCVKYEPRRGGPECVKYGKKPASQPQESTRLRCANRNDNDNCRVMERVRFFQSETRKVTEYGDRGGPLRKFTVTIPACN